MAAQGLQGLHPLAAQGLHFAAAQGLHPLAAQGLHFAAAQGLHFLAAQGLHFAAEHCASAGALAAPIIRTMSPTATPANTKNGMTVLDKSTRFVEIIASLPIPELLKQN